MVNAAEFSKFSLSKSLAPQIKPNIGDLITHDLFSKKDYQLSDKDCLQFMRQGHLRLQKLFKTSKNDINIKSPDCLLGNKLRNSIIEMFATDTESKLAAYRHKVRVLLNNDDSDKLSLDECNSLLSTVDQSDIPFMQLFNIWKKCPLACSISHSTVLGQIAADLLNVDSVRLYQDSVFMKSAGDGPTLWHSDLNMCPFDTNDFLTFWIPLQDIPR